MRTSANQPAEVPADLWRRADVMAALDARDIGALFRLVRQHAGLSQHRIGAAIDVSQGEISHIMRGERQVSNHAVLLRIADGLNMPDHGRVALGLAPREPQSPRQTPNRPVHESGIVNATAGSAAIAPSNRIVPPTAAQQSESAESEEDSVHRRTVLYGLVGAVAAPTIDGDRIESLRRNLDCGLNADATSLDVDEWEHVANEYAHDVGLISPDTVLRELLTDLEEIRARLSTASGTVHLGLTRVCAQLSALAAITLLNLDQAPAARRYWRTAIRAADQTNERSLQSLIRGRRAVFALYDQRSATAVLALADEAIAAAGGSSNAGTASGYAARAQALALLGQHNEARDALVHLAVTFNKLPESTLGDRGSQWGWSEQRLRHVESHVYSYAADIKNAGKAQDQARSLYPSQLYQGPTQIELHKAVCLINSGDPSEGARHTIRTLTALPATVRRDALVRRTAALTLDAIPEGAARLPDVSQARELLALADGSV